MKKMIQTFEGAQYIVTPSGSCAAMFKEYPVLFKGDRIGKRKLLHWQKKHMN